jgi:hypothetical protein
MLVPRRWFFFRKWYFDAQADDGSFVFLYFADLWLAGTRGGQLVVCLAPAGGPPCLRAFSIPGRCVAVSEDCRQAEFGSGALTTAGTGLVRFKKDDTEISLSYVPRDPPWLPPDDGRLLTLDGRQLVWHVPVPRAAANGTVTIGSTSVSFAGLGYHDFVETDIPPWKLPLRELLWGRALGRDGALIWNRLVLASPQGPQQISRGWWRKGTAPASSTTSLVLDPGDITTHPTTGESYPATMRISCPEPPEAEVPRGPALRMPVPEGAGEPRGPAVQMPGPEGAGEPRGPAVQMPGPEGRTGDRLSVQLTDTHLTLGDHVADVTGFSSRFERWLYRKFTGNPVEYKLLSRAHGSCFSTPALAAHERVRWGRPTN